MQHQQAPGSQELKDNILRCAEQVDDLLPDVDRDSGNVSRINELSGLRDLAQCKPPTSEEAAQIEAWTNKIETLFALTRTTWLKVRALLQRVAQLMSALPLQPAELRDLQGEVERLPLFTFGQSVLPFMQQAQRDLPVLRARLTQVVGYLSPAPEAGARLPSPQTGLGLEGERPRLPDGTDAPSLARWEDLEICFLSDERVQLRVGTYSETRNYAEMGFQDRRDRRTGKPIRAWAVLRQFAAPQGMIPKTLRSPDWPKIEKRIQEIRSRLRSLYRCPDDPIPFRRREGYQARFRVKVSPSYDH